MWNEPTTIRLRWDVQHSAMSALLFTLLNFTTKSLLLFEWPHTKRNAIRPLLVWGHGRGPALLIYLQHWTNHNRVSITSIFCTFSISQHPIHFQFISVVENSKGTLIEAIVLLHILYGNIEFLVLVIDWNLYI